MNYLVRRGVPLPLGHRIAVMKSEFIPELQPPRPIYVTHVYVLRHGKRDIIYIVSIDPRSWTVDDFTDTRSATPLRG